MTPTRNLWPLGIVAAFAVFIIGTASLILFAFTQKMDLVSADYYEQEIRYQKQIERLDRTRRLDVPASVTYDPARQRITISLPIEHARRSATGRIQLYRPSAAGLDRQMNLELDSQGTHSFDAKPLRPGLWKVRVSWRVENQDYFIDQSVVVDSGTS